MTYPMKMVCFFMALAGFYSAWATGFAFEFKECEMFPNYSMLANGFAQGRLDIQESTVADTVVKDGRRYIFSGPLPALLRLPFTLLFGWEVPTGLMIVLFCAATAAFFALTINEWTPPAADRQVSLTKKMFSLVFALNGISLHMVTIPSLHHESISAAMCFLMISIFLIVRLYRRGFRASPLNTILLGLSLSCSIASRFSYIYVSIAIGCIFISGISFKSDHLSKKERFQSLSLLSGIGILTITSLLWYNQARFGEALNFGMEYIDTMYRDYFSRGGYFKYDHFPFNAWSFFFRLPQFYPEFPFIILPGYWAQIHSVQLPAGTATLLLMNTNELVVSIFFILPILFLALVPVFLKDNGYQDKFPDYWVLWGCLVCRYYRFYLQSRRLRATIMIFFQL